MTPFTEDSTDDPSDESTSNWLGIGRRTLLKALGVGTAASLGSGPATAAGGASDARNGGEVATHQIDPVFGYPTTDAEDVPEGLHPDHEIELHREFPDDPEDPDHPSLFHFEPSGLRVNAGDVVQFTFTDPNHTVTAYHPGHGFQRRVPEHAPPFSAPIVQKDGAWLYRFDHEGVYDLYCGPHEIAGMAMRLVVGTLGEEELPAYVDTYEADPPLFAPLSPESLAHELNATSEQNENVEWVWPTDREVLDTDALNPMHIQEAGEVPYQQVADELGLAYQPEH